MSDFKKAGSHPLIQDYNNLVDGLGELEKAINSARRDAEVPESEYKWEVEFNHEEDTFRLAGVLVNEGEKNAYMDVWGQINGAWEKTRTSVTYFRTKEGILAPKHGGWLLLKTPTVVTDGEWDLIKSGSIPGRLID